VSEIVLHTRSPFGVLVAPGRYGRCVGGQRPVVMRERPDLQLRVISARAGKRDAIAASVHSVTGLALPQGPKHVGKDGLALIGTGPEQWLAIAEGNEAQERLGKLTSALVGLASSVDQSDGKAVLRIAGPRARDTLAKGCSLDLHQRVFQAGDAATTQIALIDCQLWQVDAIPTYDLAVPSSYAQSFWSWLTLSAAEYGYAVDR
jgi:heterotetrameric sarcosine oxidase gamma subunit